MSAVSGLRFYDAHNHLQDSRFGGRQLELVRECAGEGIVRMVVNGSCEADWPEVLALTRAHVQVLPSFGYHPWYVHERSPDWAGRLAHFLDAAPSAMGEIGLDRWKAGLSYASQEEVFQTQLRLAAERNRPVSIHCLRAWGRLFELLRANPRPACGFLLHSYGGPREMVAGLAGLGAYFGFPGYFLHERKARQRETFRHVPLDRLLVETDAPDQAPPDPGPPDLDAAHRPGSASFFRLTDSANSQPINHPANLGFVYHGLANVLGVDLDRLAARMEENFDRLFGNLLTRQPLSARPEP